MEIIEMRKKLGLTQAEFGRKYKIPSRTVRNIESGGKNNPLLKSLLERAVLEDCDPNFPKKPYCLGFNMTRILDYSHLTQKEFAERYNILPSTINNWVTGYRKPKIYILMLLERFVREDMNEPWKSYIAEK